MNNQTIVGVEVAKTSIVCCPLELHQMPQDYAAFSRSYTPITLLPNLSGLQTLLELGDTYVIEPTGDYSKIWIDSLRVNDKDVRRVNPKRVRALKEYHGIFSKTDRYDGAFLALYGAENLNKPTAFLSDYAEDLRELVLQHNFLTRMTGNHQRRLWQMLSHEWPEVCQSRNGTKPRQTRNWLTPDPPGLIRFIAGEEYLQAKRRQASLESTIGSGLSELSKALASQICELERRQYPLEPKISELLKAQEFTAYHEVFDLFGFGEMTRACILSRIFPFAQFLGADGKPIKVKQPSATGGRSHRRDKSMGAFRLALGNGTKVYQSGQEKREKAAGPKYARVALFLHVKTRVVLKGRGALSAPKYLSKHRALYESLTPMPHKQAVSKVISRVVKDLYRELLSAL